MFQKDGVVKSIEELKKEYRNISFGPNTPAELGWSEYTPPPPPPLDYKMKRAVEYASLQDQLDMMYWDKINNTTTWVDHIASIKTKHPKP